MDNECSPLSPLDLAISQAKIVLRKAMAEKAMAEKAMAEKAMAEKIEQAMALNNLEELEKLVKASSSSSSRKISLKGVQGEWHDSLVQGCHASHLAKRYLRFFASYGATQIERSDGLLQMKSLR